MVTKEQMNKVLPFNQCYSIFLKPHVSFVHKEIFDESHEELKAESYMFYFNKTVDDTIIRNIHNYHDHKEMIAHSQVTSTTTCNIKLISVRIKLYFLTFLINYLSYIFLHISCIQIYKLRLTRS